MSYKFLSTIQAISATFTGNSVYSNSTPNRTVKVDATGLYLSRTSDGAYPSSITADGSMYYDTRNSHIFRNDGTASMTLFDNTRNVGIGTSTDSGYKLDVNGTAVVRGIFYAGTTNTGLNFSGADCNIFNSGGSAGNISFSLGGNKYLNIDQITGSSSGFTSGTFNTFLTARTYSWSSGTAISNVFSITPTVNNTSTYTGTFRGIYYNPTLTSLTGTTHRAIETVTGDVIFNSTSGSVGIGTTSPGQKLDVNGNIRLSSNSPSIISYTSYASNIFTVKAQQTSGQDIGGMIIDTGNGESRFGSFRLGGGYFTTFYVNNSELIRLSTSNNVLIGTTTDSGYKLDVAGIGRYSSTAGGYKLTVETTGGGNGNGLLVTQLGYTMLDVNTSSVVFKPFPSASGQITTNNWNSAGGSHTTFFTKNSEFTPTGYAYAIPIAKFPDANIPVVMGNTATASLRSYLNVSGNFTAISNLAAGQQITSTLTAAANNDVLVGLDINPTFTNGAYTGVSNWGIRSQARVFINPTISTTNSLLRLTDNVNGTAWMGFSTVVATGFFIGANGSVTLGQGVSGDNSAPTGAFVNLRSSSGSRITLNTNSAAEGIIFSDNYNATIRMQFPSANEAAITTITSHNLSIGTSTGAASAVTNTLKFFQSTGNVFIGSSPTDAGYKLDVSGTARFQGNVTTSAGTKVTVGSIEIFDNTAGIRQINALGNQAIQVTAGTTNVTLNNSNSNGNIVLNSNGSGGYVILRPNGSNSGIYFSGSNAVPSYNQMTFYNNRNDGNKSAIINTVDFAASGFTPIDLYLYAGKETVLNNQGNIYLAYDGTNTRGSVNIGGTSTASAILNLTSTTQGFLPPRMTNAQRTAISTPAVGLIVYQTDSVEGVYVYTSGGWKSLTMV